MRPRRFAGLIKDIKVGKGQSKMDVKGHDYFYSVDFPVNIGVTLKLVMKLSDFIKVVIKVDILK